VGKTVSEKAWLVGAGTCFKRVEDSGVIHMAGIIRKMAKDLEMLQINHNKLSHFVKTHIKTDQDKGGNGGGGRAITAFNPLAEIAEQIRALSIQLNDCEVGSPEAKAISDQLNVLQGIKQSQYGAPSPTKKIKPR
jgi:hypothetical protein